MTACATTKLPDPPPVQTQSQGQTHPQTQPQTSSQTIATPATGPIQGVSSQPTDSTTASSGSQASTPVITLTPSHTTTANTAFSNIAHWPSTDLLPGLKALEKSCLLWQTEDPQKPLSDNWPEYGRIQDWLPTCQFVQNLPRPLSSDYARLVFETEFLPIVTPEEGSTGLLTAYYSPEISVSRTASAIYSEPILALPTSETVQNLQRSQLSAQSSQVIAYGRPIEVFFLQIQGSGRMVFEDGSRIRAAYAGHNGHAYTSIGRVLVDRGEMTLEQASKQAIEDWMQRAGSEATTALMNENKRYIFFKEEPILGDEGPKGAMRVPLSDFGSLAVDPAHLAYGVPVFLQVKIPQFGGDYVGSETGLLVVAQDTGKAIRGPLRGDIYFGAGDLAGEKAGVMKHEGRWIILLPTALALQILSLS